MPIVRSPQETGVYWAGKYSECRPNGAIERYVESIVNKLSFPVSCIFIQSDGFFGKNECSETRYQLGGITNDIDFSRLENLKKSGTYPIVISLCTRNFDRTNILLSPLDDASFDYGVQCIFQGISIPSWEDRKNVVFWRGGCSGHDRPTTIRLDVTNNLYPRNDCDVRLTKWDGWNGQIIPNQFFGELCDLSYHLQHKYILIVDGNCIASNHQWVFGSGAVPIMITHPKNDYWFKRYLKPMVNYVPISYDLSDLHEKIDWLQCHPEEAKSIAEEAVRFSQRVFSPEFQRYHIETEIASIVYGASSLEYFYHENVRTYSDIHEHLPTLREYASRCTSVIECGVRDIVSSYAFACGLKNNPAHSLIMIDCNTSVKMGLFLELCQRENVNASFIEANDIQCERSSTDLLFIDTWHVYGHLKRELAYWHSFVGKYIILHDTTVDAVFGETIRCEIDAHKQSIESGYPVREITMGLWPAVEEFLVDNPEWKLEKRYENNNGLTILVRI